MEDYSKAHELSGVDVLVLATLLSFAADDDRPQAFASAPRIAARSRLARRTVQRALEHLEDVGVIAGEHRHRRPTRWSLDPYFTKAGGVTQSPASVRETPVKRQRDAQQASERRSAGVTEALQGTEVGSGAKRRNRTDVKGGSGSGKPARSARRGSLRSAAEVSGDHTSVPQPKPDPPRCPHGVPGGLSGRANHGSFSCDTCTSLAPYPWKTLAAWEEQYPDLEEVVKETELRCTDPDRDRVARAVGRATYLTRYSGSLDAPPGSADFLFARIIHAYVVDQLEPGRVAELMTNGKVRLALARLPGRCPECEAHVDTQGHRPGCGRMVVVDR
jgi:hypothetical protein